MPRCLPASRPQLKRDPLGRRGVFPRTDLPITLADPVTLEVVVEPEIEVRLRVSAKSKYTRQYVALEDGSERAFVALDLEPSRAVLYELWVPTAQRGHGVGTAVLTAVEGLALRAGCTTVVVRPKPLDSGIDPERLARFYRTHGYEPLDADPGLMSKVVRI